jgi:D-3-phosphoglycerate dehydrogenase
MTTCEHAISLLMSLVRNVPQGDATMKAGLWDKKKLTGVELYGKTLGVIGLGKIGREVAKRMIAFGMTVWGYDPYVSTEVAERLGIILKSVSEIVDGADVVMIHTPKTPETTNLIGAAELKRMKKSAFLVNCARGGIVNEEALVEALQAGEIACGARCLHNRTAAADHRCARHRGWCWTPHLGASTVEAQEKVGHAGGRAGGQLLQGFRK